VSGRLTDAMKMLDYAAGLGFDVVYLPPIFPIGVTNRKGRNGSRVAGPTDPGSPWAIGSAAGGHTTVHPDLGTIDDFRVFSRHAQDLGLEIALDLALQCSPEHPWVSEHPEWFRHRPDGSIRYAENPPKRYEDIVPLDFEGEAWESLWNAVRDVVAFWVDEGVRIFRVDNPHTKPFGLWEWLIRSIRSQYPDVVFLAEAFTRPAVMNRLAKVGFSQSYTYFAWRNTRYEIETYFTELTKTPRREYFRPNLWPNTPDNLTDYLQTGGRPAFVVRLVLAATLGASYGIYGPAFELCEATPRSSGSEEYAGSEKFQVRTWDLDRGDSLRNVVARVNAIRRQHSALHSDDTLEFHACDNQSIICYSKTNTNNSDVIVVVANLDPFNAQSGNVTLDLAALGVDDEVFQLHDLLGGLRVLWRRGPNPIQLHPNESPAHVFTVRRRVRTEQDFEYYL
jgi:starch synthase (maltosyl-transferring)